MILAPSFTKILASPRNGLMSWNLVFHRGGVEGFLFFIDKFGEQIHNISYHCTLASLPFKTHLPGNCFLFELEQFNSLADRVIFVFGGKTRITLKIVPLSIDVLVSNWLKPHPTSHIGRILFVP